MAKAKAKKKKRAGVGKAEALRVQQRIDELVRVRLDGALFLDVRAYVREKEALKGSPWKLAARARPLSDSQLRRYVRRADRIIMAAGREKRSRAISRHVTVRRHLYGKAVGTGDLRTALACAQDEAKLKGLYPSEKHKHEVGGPGGGAIPFKVYGFDPTQPDAPADDGPA